MKAEIRNDGIIEIIAETAAEAFAVKFLCSSGIGPCILCDQAKMPFILNCSVLNEDPVPNPVPSFDLKL